MKTILRFLQNQQYFIEAALIFVLVSCGVYINQDQEYVSSILFGVGSIVLSHFAKTYLNWVYRSYFFLATGVGLVIFGIVNYIVD